MNQTQPIFKDMPKDKCIYLIDGSAYIYRAYHALQGFSTSEGFPTNAVFGFTRMLLKLIKDKSPQYIGLFFDAPGKTFRHDMYAEYKANRPEMPDELKMQIEPVKDITAGFNIPIIEKSEFEADDLIGTIAKKAEKAGLSVVMVTGDKDFIQLVSDKAIIWDPMKDKTIDIKKVRKEYQFEPYLFRDMLGLMGDKSDNIPGVPGIGPKTAGSLVKTFSNIENLYENIDQISKKKLRENLIKYKEQVFLSKQLACINTNVDIEFDYNDFIHQEPDNDRLFELFGKFEFRQLRKSVQKKNDLSKKDYKAIFKLNELKQLVEVLKNTDVFAIDTETTSKNSILAQLVGISIAVKPDQAFYIPLNHEYIDESDGQLPAKDVLAILKPVLENPDIKKAGQNIKYDKTVFAGYNINIAGIFFDTMLASYLLNPSKRSHSLDQIAADFLNHKTITYSEIAQKGKEKQGFNTIPMDKAIPYACEDADITLSAYKVLNKLIKKTHLDKLMQEVEIPLISVLTDMEIRGIEVDVNILKTLSTDFMLYLAELEEHIYKAAGESFNINSSVQLSEILFDKLKLPVQKKTKKKTGYSTDVDVLTQLAKKHKLPNLILQHRTIAKLKSTYADSIIELINPRTKRIHTSFNQTITATGRLSSSNPNLQNIPVRTKEGRQIREAFIPKPGWLLMSADYSQIELRILAHYSKDPILTKAFIEDEDIHTRTAAEVLNIFPEMIDQELRRQAKAINFGIIYGMSAYGLAKSLDISRKMAQNYIDSYFARYSKVKEFIDKTIDQAEKTKKTSTLLDRIRLLPDINNPNRNVRNFAQRTAINTPIQGTAADFIKLAMIKTDRVFKEKSLQSAMLLSVHDEIIFEVPPDELETVKKLVTEIMENVWDIDVPLKVNIGWGKNWAEAAH